MGIFFENVTFMGMVGVCLLMLILLGINEVTRRSKWLSVLAYGVLPVVLALLVWMGVLGSPTGKTWFGWVKVISALIGVWGFMLIRFTKLGETKFTAIFPTAILSINIAEAVYRELEVFVTYKTLQVDAGGVAVLGGTWNILNAIAGILCIVTLTGFVHITVSKDQSRDMIWPDMTWLYIVGYTLWNLTYVYNCISTRVMYAGVAILLAAVIAEYVFKRGAWLQHRAQILSLYVMFSLSVDFQASPLFQIKPHYTPANMMCLSVVTFLFCVGMLVYMLYTIKKYRINPIKTSLYAHTKAYKKTEAANQLSL